jgi:predicted DNA binding protein
VTSLSFGCPEQREVARLRANAVRLRRAAVRKAVVEGDLTLLEALADESTATTSVAEILAWTHKPRTTWRRAHHGRLLMRAGVTAYARWGDLTDRQRRLLTEALSS